MKILFLTPCYNEILLLPYQKEHLDGNQIDLFVIDNMSNDGSSEWLVKNKIQHSKLDTNGAFDLRPIHAEMNKVLHEIKPDWVVYGACDMFYESEFGFRGMIEDADSNGFNQIETRTFDFTITGEKVKSGNPFKNYHTVRQYAISQILISKYDKDLKIVVDGFFHPSPNVKRNAGVSFEMHAAKTIEQRTELYRRREVAWENGLNRGYGVHYKADFENNYKEKYPCCSISELPEFELYKKLQSL